MGFSISGLGSGIDTAGLVSQLMQAERAPQAKITAQQKTAEKKVSAWTDLRTKMQALQTAAEALKTPRQALGSVATASDLSVLKATASSGAPVGSYSVLVKNLAVAQQQTRTGLGPPSMTVGAGRSYLTAGDLSAALDLTGADAGVHVVEVTRAPAPPTAYGTPVLTGLATDLTISLDGAAPTTLVLQSDHVDAAALVQDVQDQLTAAGLAATATLVGGRLQISGRSEGEGSDLLLGGGAATALGLPTATVTGQDALVSVDGTSQTIAPVPAGTPSQRELLGETGMSLLVGDRLRVGTTRSNVVETTASTTLGDLQTMLNATGSPVNAAVVSQGGSSTLVLSATSSGVGGSVSVAAGTPVLAGLTTTAAVDAHVVLNGVDVSSSSNTLRDVVPGLTLDLLHAPTDGLERTVTVGRDSGGTGDKAKALVDGLNAMLTLVTTSTRSDVKGGTRGPLAGDSTARSLSASLFSQASSTPGSGAWRGLSQIGISTTRDGGFTFTREDLDKALAADPDGVATMLAGFAASVADYAKGVGATGGLLSNRREGAQTDADARQVQVDAMEVRLAATEKRYKAQYAKLESALASLTSKGSAVSAALSGLTSSSR